MIKVDQAPEPADFDIKVRKKGLAAIDEMVGISPRKRSGPKRQIFPSKELIPSDKFPPYWRDALPQLYKAYSGICAYSSLRIHLGTGSRTVDHYVPVNENWDKVYEWDNYRLACSHMNALKSTARHLLDPFEVVNGWFALDLDLFYVILGDQAPKSKEGLILDTIKKLGLNEGDFPQAREFLVRRFWKQDITFRTLVEDAPFVAAELERQNRFSE